ncbi:MAG TPA: hypothetical protein EYN38_05000 [Flavobacteriales bacterium]|nr:hypothetical protein [Flavobacteriales bacterium]
MKAINKLSCVLICFLALGLSHRVAAQNYVVQTKGKEFWIGFLQNDFLVVPTDTLKVFISSDINTQGVLSIPNQGFTQNFTVTANMTTTVIVNNIMAEPTALLSEVIGDQGILIETDDTVSVFAINYQAYSIDATKVLPIQSLGTDYIIASYNYGYPNPNPGYSSEFIVVATADGTQISITPSDTTLNGQSAGVPFTVNMDRGDTYFVKALSALDDFTGTTIKATANSGACRPFAVFSGAVSTVIPDTCGAGDHIYEQNHTVSVWGTEYYLVPFASSYTYRVMASENGTAFSINGGPNQTLNAGEYFEQNFETSAICIVANQAVAVIQYMEGRNCVGSGDPSMLITNSEEQKIDNVTFATVNSNVIANHYLNIIMKTVHVGQLTLDGITINPSLFSPFPSCPLHSYAQISITTGNHTLDADSGFTAYVYGARAYESYAYSVGSFSPERLPDVDTVYCTLDSVTLAPPELLINPWWATTTDPGTVIGVGQNLTVTPTVSDVYIVTGDNNLSGCQVQYLFTVELPTPPTLNVTQDLDTVCQYQVVQLDVSPNPPSTSYVYSWTPSIGLSNANISNPIASPTSTISYMVVVSQGICSSDTGYLTVTVQDSTVAVAYPDTMVCIGTAVTLHATGGGQYVWSPAGDLDFAIIADPVATPSITTNYQVVVTNAFCPPDTAILTLNINQIPNVMAYSDTTIVLGSSANLSAEGGTTYSWSTGQVGSSISVSPTTTTTYSVNVTDTNGCTNSTQITVTVVEEYAVYVPNIFSISSENLDHSRLYVFGKGIESLVFTVYDRWGDLVYESSDASASLRSDGACCSYGTGWDGTYKETSKPLNSAVFVYKLTGFFTNGKEFIESGNITLIK